MILRAKPIWPLTEANLTSPQGADNYVKVPYNDLSKSLIIITLLCMSVSMLFLTQTNLIRVLLKFTAQATSVICSS